MPDYLRDYVLPLIAPGGSGESQALKVTHNLWSVQTLGSASSWFWSSSLRPSAIKLQDLLLDFFGDERLPGITQHRAPPDEHGLTRPPSLTGSLKASGIGLIRLPTACVCSSSNILDESFSTSTEPLSGSDLRAVRVFPACPR